MPQLMADDPTYLSWMKANPGGFVLNSYNPARQGYLILHRATCHTITGTPANGRSWTKDYSKTCSVSREDLEDWTRHSFGDGPKRCGICDP